MKHNHFNIYCVNIIYTHFYTNYKACQIIIVFRDDENYKYYLILFDYCVTNIVVLFVLSNYAEILS